MKDTLQIAINKTWSLNKRQLKQRLCLLTVKKLSPIFEFTNEDKIELEAISTVTNIDDHINILKKATKLDFLPKEYFREAYKILGGLEDKEVLKLIDRIFN